MTGDGLGAGHQAEYVLPLRWSTDEDAEELGGYLRWLATRVDVTVVDGSPPDLFRAHARLWAGVRHIAPEAAGLNGKACGVVTGLRHARHDAVVIADDDVRYDEDSLAAVLRRLRSADVVRPQNVFRPRPWHAAWDTGRSLINRAAGGDYAGTLAVRRALAAPGYDTDVLFENLELERTIRARGGAVDVARDVFVERRPPSAARFREQRVRQAYDSFAQPLRLLAELALLPGLLGAILRRRPEVLLAVGSAAVGLAAAGRLRAGGRAVFARRDVLWALPWVLERSVTAWIALGWRLRGGVPYRGRRLLRAGTPERILRRRAAEARDDGD